MDFGGFASDQTCRLCCQVVADAAAVHIAMDFYVKFKEITNYEVF